MASETSARRPAAGRRALRTLAVTLLVGYAAWCTLLYARQDAMLFPRAFAGSGGPVPDGVEHAFLETPAGRVEYWFLPGDGCSADAPGPLAVLFHGNAELIDHCTGWAAAYTSRGVSVLLPEYRGYGRSGGLPAQDVIVADAAAMLDAVLADPRVDRARVVFHGRSLGGGVAVQLAAERPPNALILQSTFTSVASFAAGMGAPPFLCKNPFRSDEVLSRLARPVLVLHGTQDEIIPREHGQRLAEISRGEYHEAPGGHNDFPRDRADFWKAIDAFLSRNSIIRR